MAFRESLWTDVLTQYAIEDRSNGHGIGLVSAYNANPIHGYAFINMVLHPLYRYRVWPLEAGVLFANYLFVKFNLRVIYAETAAPHFEHFRSGAGKMFEVEGHFRNRLIINGRPEDLYVLAFTRERWLEEGQAVLERCLPVAAGPGSIARSEVGDRSGR